MKKAPHPACLLRGSLVSPSLEAAVLNGKYINAVPFARLEKEFGRYGLAITRQNMANWTIECADRYLAVFYDYLHKYIYKSPVIHADETHVLVRKDGREAGSKSYMWVYRTGEKEKRLIIDTIRGAQSSAIIYSIAETAKANNLKPYEYFEYLLEEIPQHMEDTDLNFCENLSPWSTSLPEKCRKPGKK